MPRGVGVAWIASRALARLQAEADTFAPLETGGVLLGYQSPDETETVVTDVVGGGPGAERTRTSFVPDHDYQESEIARIYEASGRCTTYLGDWHTHPGGTCAISRTDKKTLRTIAHHRESRLRRPVMLIAAPGTPEWDVAVWQWRFGWTALTGRALPASVRVFSPPNTS